MTNANDTFWRQPKNTIIESIRPKKFFQCRSELWEDRDYDCGCNSGSPLRDNVVSLEKELIRLWNSILPEPGQPSAQLPKLIRLNACKKSKHTVSRWYRTVYNPLLVNNSIHKINILNDPTVRCCGC